MRSCSASKASSKVFERHFHLTCPWTAQSVCPVTQTPRIGACGRKLSYKTGAWRRGYFSDTFSIAQVVHPLYRFLRTRALLFRPSLLRALKAKAVLANTVHPPAATLASRTSASARQLCFECACEQIDLCYATTTTQLDAPWFRRFCRQIVAGAIRSGAPLIALSV